MRAEVALSNDLHIIVRAYPSEAQARHKETNPRGSSTYLA
jgi:hypothetical protein